MKTTRQPTRKLALSRYASLLLAFLLFLSTALACNLPIFVSPDNSMDNDTREAVRQTIEARLFATPLVGQTPGAVLPGQSVEGGNPQNLPTQPIPEVTAAPLESLPELRVVTPGVPASTLDGNTFRYVTQPGDTVESLALRFNVGPEQILDPALFPSKIYLPVGLLLAIPNTLAEFTPPHPLMPDGEILNGPVARDFSVEQYVMGAGGYLSTYTELVNGDTLTGWQIIQLVANDSSTNPILLLAFLEYRSSWVTSKDQAVGSDYPIGFYANQYSGLHKEMTLVARQLNIAYYGWRSGKVTQVSHPKGEQQRLNPTVNAGTAAIQYLFATLYNPADWQNQLYGEQRFLALYQQMFGDPWQRAVELGNLLPDSLAQPAVELPFSVGERWAFTGGPHAAWGIGSPLSALDFAPVTGQKGCEISVAWTTAVGPGVVLRAGDGQLLFDLDGDGREQTGWVVMYMHVAEKDRTAPGTLLNTGDRIGHPSCEGGRSTGAHVHLARKFNGEWIPADGPVPFVLSGYRAYNGARAYTGTLVRGEHIVSAMPDGSYTSSITR